MAAGGGISRGRTRTTIGAAPWALPLPAAAPARPVREVHSSCSVTEAGLGTGAVLGLFKQSITSALLRQQITCDFFLKITNFQKIDFMGRQVLEPLRAIDWALTRENFPVEKTEVTLSYWPLHRGAERSQPTQVSLMFTGGKKDFRNIKMENWFSKWHFKLSNQ